MPRSRRPGRTRPTRTGSATPRPAWTRPAAPPARTTGSRSSCPARTCRPGAPSSRANTCGPGTTAARSSPARASTWPSRGPERIALTGANGAGKSTLLRLISGDRTPVSGTAARADGRVAYLSQRLDLLDPARTVAENLAAFAPALPDADRMNLLARFLFRGSRVHLPVRVLSGGERLRATLACILFAEPAPQLLLLDEPTNNLDLVSVGQLEGALVAYQGAFVVVSHDERFLTEIGVTRWLRLADGHLAETGAPEAG